MSTLLLDPTTRSTADTTAGAAGRATGGSVLVHVSESAPVPAAPAALAPGDGPDDGMTTAEYAVGTLAACALAALLFLVVKDQGVQHAMIDLFTSALSTRGA